MARIYLQLRSQPDEDKWATWNEPCPVCGREHPSLWYVTRKIVETFGHFPVIRLNGKKEVIDPTLPEHVDRLPRDAVRVLPADFARLWHGTGHIFE